MDTPARLVERILAASARASLLTVVVLMVQALLRHRVSARWRYALWLPVLIVLLMPVFPESSWSVHSITQDSALVLSASSSGARPCERASVPSFLHRTHIPS